MDEFDRQRDLLVDLGIPELSGTSARQFVGSVEALRELAEGVWPPDRAGDERQPFVIVPDLGLAGVTPLVSLMRLPGSDRVGILDRNHGEQGLEPYHPLPDLGIPTGAAYLVVDIDRGDDYLGVRPRDAVRSITQSGRSPLTITEGVLLQLVRPDLLQPNRCFMLAGSRRGDKRVPALWISERAPKLGWCWEGNPHTWLGTASAARRLTAAKAPRR